MDWGFWAFLILGQFFGNAVLIPGGIHFFTGKKLYGQGLAIALIAASLLTFLAGAYGLLNVVGTNGLRATP